LPQLQVHQISRSFLQEGGGLDNFLRKIMVKSMGKIMGQSWQMILIYSMTTHVEDAFWYAT
jgi:hypothetical protein